MKNATNDSAKELIPRYLSGDVSVEEQKQLQEWIGESVENERHYADFKKIFELGEKHYKENNTNQAQAIDVDYEWNHFIATVSKKDDKPVRRLEPNAKPAGMWYKIAASLLLLVASAFILNYFLSKPTTLHYQTANNTIVVALPDGSKVTLNRHSQLDYASTFGDVTRPVTLKGEAFFDVAHNAKKPFTVTVNKAIIEVVGTSFNVRGYGETKPVEVIVKTGVVKLFVPTLNTSVKLKAGEKGSYAIENTNLVKNTNTDINFEAWNTQQIVFEESDLHTVIETLNHVYGVNIVLATSIPPSCVVTVTFDHQSLESVLHVLETTLNLTFTTVGTKIEITNAGC